MEKKVSDNVIEKNYRECLKFNEINESKVDNFDMAIAKAALENLYELYKMAYQQVVSQRIRTM